MQAAKDFLKHVCEDFRILFEPKSSVLAEMLTMAPEPSEAFDTSLVVFWRLDYEHSFLVLAQSAILASLCSPGGQRSR